MEYSVKELIDLLFVTDEQERIEAKKSSSIGNSIMDDLPNAFNLKEEDLQATETPLLPRRLVREAIVNALMHRNCRTADTFIATYLFHHFLSPEDMKWLANFADFKLSDEDAMALIFAREAEAIDNLTLRHLTGMDTLSASQCLQKLRDSGLLEQKGKGRSTYYLPSVKFIATLEVGPLGAEVVSLAPELVSLRLKKELVSLESLPDELKELVSNFSRRASREKVSHIVLALTAWNSLNKEDFGSLLKRDAKLFWRRHLTPMRVEGLIEYTIPDMINHPKQAYKITEKGRKKLTEQQ